MDGSSATDDLGQAHRTQVRLAVNDAPAVSVSNEYFYHMEKRHPLPATHDISIQDRVLGFCSPVTGVKPPFRFNAGIERSIRNKASLTSARTKPLYEAEISSNQEVQCPCLL